MTPGGPDFLHWSVGDAKISTYVENRKTVFQTEAYHFNVWLMSAYKGVLNILLNGI
jgi:hypothetical protein